MAAEPESNHRRPRFGPSERLSSMFRACSDRDLTEVIQTRLRRMLQIFLQHHRDNAENESTNALAGECCRQAGIWYYRILEKLAIQESKRLGISGILGFLNHEHCQRCLIACCLEISISSNKLPCEFPLLLQIFRLAPYHFRNVIESVFRAEEHLPSTSFRHLAQVEDKILESMAWTSASPLWEEIRASGSHFPYNQQVMLRNSLEDPSSTDLQSEGNLLEVSSNPDQQPSTSAENRPQRSKSLTVFARKVYMLMDRRLKTMFSTLAISDELQSKIWTCFEHSLVNFTDIMVDRHLDQLLMCAIFIIAKVTNEEIPFKSIKRCYMTQPLTSKSVCTNVLISAESAADSLTTNRNNEDPSVSFPTPDTPSAHYPTRSVEKRGNLFNFFNQVYSAKMSDFANRFAAHAGVSTPPLTPYPRQNKAPPPRKLYSKYNISISVYNRTMSPQHTSGRLDSDNSEHLPETNNTVSGRVPSRRSRVALRMEGEEADGTDGPPLRRLCFDDQSALQRRLVAMENDRAARQNQA